MLLSNTLMNLRIARGLVRNVALCVLSIWGCVVCSEHAFAQNAVVTSNANLRSGPGSTSSAIRLMHPGEHLTVLSLTPTGRYYNVATDLSEQGWVYGPYIDIDESINTGVVKRNTIFVNARHLHNRLSECCRQMSL